MHPSDDSLNAEEITQLRYQLFKANSDRQKYIALAKNAEIYQHALEQLTQALSNRTDAVRALAVTLGIRVKDFSEPKTRKGKEEEAEAWEKGKKLQAELREEEDLLKRINQFVGQLVIDHGEANSKLEQLRRQHAHCGDVGALATENLEKLRQIEQVIGQKDASIMQLQNINQTLEEELISAAKKNEECTKRLQTLQAQVERREKEMDDNKNIVESAEESSKEKQRVLDNCQRLLELVSVPQDDYLKYHFRTSGLVLEPQRQQKSKYSIVFDQ